jgi:hypothetical protein
VTTSESPLLYVFFLHFLFAPLELEGWVGGMGRRREVEMMLVGREDGDGGGM